MKKKHFFLVKKFKNTVSAQLCVVDSEQNCHLNGSTTQIGHLWEGSNPRRNYWLDFQAWEVSSSTSPDRWNTTAGWSRREAWTGAPCSGWKTPESTWSLPRRGWACRADASSRRRRCWLPWRRGGCCCSCSCCPTSWLIRTELGTPRVGGSLYVLRKKKFF